MLVKLYNLPDSHELVARLRNDGVVVRRALPPERHLVLAWVRQHFSPAWESECAVAFGQVPVTCFVALREQEILGFGCYDTTCKDFFGPTGVKEEARGQGIGTALLLACLEAMRAQGYAYAIIGSAGPVDYYRKAVGATVIEESSPGIYVGMLRDRT